MKLKIASSSPNHLWSDFHILSPHAKSRQNHSFRPGWRSHSAERHVSPWVLLLCAGHYLKAWWKLLASWCMQFIWSKSRNNHSQKQTWVQTLYQDEWIIHASNHWWKKNPQVFPGVPQKNVIIGRDYSHYYYLALNRALYLQSFRALYFNCSVLCK